jgi:hypothetical protein
VVRTSESSRSCFLIALRQAVTHAALTNWEYMDVIRTFADPVCSANLVHSVAIIDTLINIPVVKDHLKGLFNLSGLSSDQDFASVIEVFTSAPSLDTSYSCHIRRNQSPLGSWQDKNWDPAVGSTQFDDFCAALNGNTSSLADTTEEVPFVDGHKINIALLNYAKYIRDVRPVSLIV